MTSSELVPAIDAALERLASARQQNAESSAVLVLGDLYHGTRVPREVLEELRAVIEKAQANGERILVAEPESAPSREDSLKGFIDKIKATPILKRLPASGLPYWRQFEKRKRYS